MTRTSAILGIHRPAGTKLLSAAIIILTAVSGTHGQTPPPAAPAENDASGWYRYEESIRQRWTSGQLPEEQFHQEVLATVQDPDPGVRQAALKALPALKEKAAFAAQAVAKLLNDETRPPTDYIGSGGMSPMGQLAARALAAMGPAGQPLLADAAGGDKAEARRSALSVAEDIEDPSLVDVMLKALHAQGADRGQAEAALTRGKAKYPVKPIIVACDDQDPAIRRICIAALDHCADAAGTDAIFRAIKDPDQGVRDEALNTVCRAAWIHDDRAIGILLDALAHNASDNTRADAAMALGNYHDWRVERALIAAVDDPHWFNVGANSAAAMAAIGDRCAAPALIAHAQAWSLVPKVGVGQKTLSALEGWNSRPYPPASVPLHPPGETPDAYMNDLRRGTAPSHGLPAGRILPLEPILALAGSPDAKVRAAALEELGSQGNPAGFDALLKGLGDPDETVQAVARSAIARSGGWLHDDRAIDPLIDALARHPDRTARSAAAYSLGNYPKDRVVKALLAALNDDFCETRAGAITSLAKIGNRDAVPALIKVMNDKAGSADYLDLEALTALGDLGGEQALAALTDLFKTDDPYLPLSSTAIEKITGKPIEQFPAYQQWLKRHPSTKP